MDPLSIAGLTLSVLDQLWRVGDRTAELVGNFRDYDQDTKNLEMRIRDENNRSKALKMLLFEPSTIYGGKSLFEQFDSDVQDQIHLFLEQATGVLDQAHQLLNRRQETYGKDANENGNGGSSGRATPTPLSPLGSPPSYHSSSSFLSLQKLSLAPPKTSPTDTSSSLGLGNGGGIKRNRSFVRIRWSLLDKKRVETIVRDFSDLNGRIHESIKLWCLGTSIGVDMQHLKRLEKDGNSQALGFDVDARLQIAAAAGAVSSIRGRSSSSSSDSSPLPQSLETDDPELRRKLMTDDFQRIGDNFGILNDSAGNQRLVEFRSYNAESPIPVEMDERTRDLVNRLANLLHQPKEVIFRIPNCVGWVRQMQKNRVAFVFAVPDAAAKSATAPVSLLRVISGVDSASSSKDAPSLGQRFYLAARLAKCISQLQLVKWVHESFRSENILFFPKAPDPSASEDGATPPAGAKSSRGGSNSAEARLDFREPWVLGFEFSRPEAFFSHGHADVCLTRDVYRHPVRQRAPTQTFNKLHDIYALGVVLLEIGLWQPALSLDKSGFSKCQDPHAIQKHLVRHAERRLASKMGERYRDVVLTCLQGSFDVVNDTKEDLKLQQAFRAQVVEPLEKAAENL